MSHLNLALLGPPEIRHAGSLLKFPTRKALALLAYLAVEGGAQPREKLIVLFWPESDAARGRAVLRNTLTYLNNLLRPGGPPHLLIERDSLAFDFSADFDLDL